MGKINTVFPLSLGTFIIPYRQNAEINVDASYNFYILAQYLWWSYKFYQGKFLC